MESTAMAEDLLVDQDVLREQVRDKYRERVQAMLNERAKPAITRSPTARAGH